MQFLLNGIKLESKHSFISALEPKEERLSMLIVVMQRGAGPYKGKAVKYTQTPALREINDAPACSNGNSLELDGCRGLLHSAFIVWLRGEAEERE